MDKSFDQKIHQQQYKSRSIGRIRLALMGTSIWGIFEVGVFSFVNYVDKHLMPNFHSYFMRFIHGKFGAIVIPFEQNLEANPKRRTWKTREKFKKNKIPEKRKNPINKYLLQAGEMVILPNEEILNLTIRSKMNINVAECFCRKYTKEHGDPCKINAPLRTCLTLSLPESIDKIAQKEPRPDLIKNEEILYNLFKKCEEIGLVHQAIYMPSPNYTYVICNCCPCCCEVIEPFIKWKKAKELHHQLIKTLKIRKEKTKEIILKNSNNIQIPNSKILKDIDKRIKKHSICLTKPVTPIIAKSVFITKNQTPDKCINCGICASRCYFGSKIMINGKISFNPEECYGCGLCVNTCPTNNIELIRRKFPKSMGNLAKNGVKHTHPHGS
ncbi:MAG: ATP-binding protein [Promethearchaeota archaeon]